MRNCARMSSRSFGVATLRGRRYATKRNGRIPKRRCANSAVSSSLRRLPIVAARYQPGPPIESQVVVNPLGQDQQPVLELHQVHQMDKDPNEPCDESADVNPAKIG